VALLGYAIRTDIENIYGKENIEQYADLNNTKNAGEIEVRINSMLELAEETINGRLREGPYVIPFAIPVVFLIKDLTARMTGVLLYDGRGIVDAEDEEEGVENLRPHRKMVESTIKQILGYKLKLDLALTSATFPQNIPL